MSTPYLGMMMTAGFNFAPRGWATCSGQLLSIQQNEALFALLGTFYGGNGTTNFALPDLRGRVQVGMGQGPGLGSYTIGDLTGTETTTLSTSQLPAHNHAAPSQATAVTASLQVAAPGDFLGKTADGAPNPASIPKIYVPAASATNPYSLGASTTTGTTGSGQPFSTLQPLLVLTQCIALQGIFPSRN